MDYPPNWDIFPMEDFITSVPRSAGNLTSELLVQARPNGRLLDHFRYVLGGSSIMNVEFQLASIWQMPAASTWKLCYQVWPKDIEIRRNMVSSTWTDIVLYCIFILPIGLQEQHFIYYRTIIYIADRLGKEEDKKKKKNKQS
jgi:hypothetical protein